MEPRAVYELSRRLALLLEEGIRERGEEKALPVFLGHPLDVFQERIEPEGEQAAGVLYLIRMGEEKRFRPAGHAIERVREPAGGEVVRAPGFWVRLRYVFLVVGGTLEDEMEALAAVLQTLHDRALLPVSEVFSEEAAAEMGVDALPVDIADASDVWREIGLPEHRLAVSFEVSLPLRSRRTKRLERVADRELEVRRRPLGGRRPW